MGIAIGLSLGLGRQGWGGGAAASPEPASITATPFVGSPAISVSGLAALGVTSTPSVGSAAISAASGLVANGVTSTPSVGTPSSSVMVTTQAPGFFGFATPDGEWDGSTEASDYVTVYANHLRSDARASVLGGGDWSSFDATLSECQAAGLPIIPILMPNSDLSDSTERADFATYCGNFMARYAGDCLAVEITNEPNIASTAILRANYALALPAVAAAIRAQDAAVPILVGSLGSVENDTGGFQGAGEFLQHLYDQNCAQYFEGVSVHLYTGSGGYAGHTGDSWHAAGILRELRAIMVAGGDTAKQIWVTETGIYSDLAGTAPTEADQKIFLQDVYDDLSALKYVAPYVGWYTHRNRSAESGTEDRFGLKRWSGAPKLAWHHFRDINALAMDGTTPLFEHQKGSGNKNHNLFRYFASAGDAIQANLTFTISGNPTGVAINSSTGVVTITDASVSPQLATAVTVRATHTNGSFADFPISLTVYHPNLIATNPTFAGDVTGWTNLTNGTLTYDAGQGSALLNITGAGGGLADNQTITCTSGVSHEYRVKVKAGTFVGSLNLGYEASDVVIGPLTDDYVWYSRTLTTTDTDAALNLRRSTAVTGTIYIDEIVFRLAL